MQRPWMSCFHTFFNGTHWKPITNVKARVPSVMTTMKAMMILANVLYVPLMMRRMKRQTEILISPVARFVCISETVVHFEASDKDGSI